MIPQITRKLLNKFASNATLLFDPYCGSGTSLVEGMVHGIDVIGTDLNPLARLIVEAKTSTPALQDIDQNTAKLSEYLNSNVSVPHIPEIHGISRLYFWFKPAVVESLANLKAFIQSIEDKSVRLFFAVAFSETVRESSNTRNEEFKLYRYEDERLEKFAPDVYGIMQSKLKRNRSGLEQFLSVLSKTEYKPTAKIYDFNTVTEVPADKIAPASIDIVITSPPYGDSHTTVAYGQYSRLSAAWLDLEEPHKIDNKLMGGKASKELPTFPSETLNKALIEIKSKDEKRAFEVASFYSDLLKSISNVARLIRAGGHACYVVGNRKVKGIILPTDIAVRDFFEESSFDYVDTFHRTIPNKRMPLKNSPTNAAGNVDSTITREYIVVMRSREA
jgi:tRNA G10  N-methylase Trm11